jgi:hypothetical protein
MKILIILSLFFFTDLKAQKELKNHIYTEYYNKNLLAIRADDTIFRDTPFQIKVPYKIRKVETSISNQFFHQLKMDKKKLIFILYCPSNNLGVGRIYNCNFNDFERFLSTLKMDSILNNVNSCKHKRFGLKIINTHYIVAYMNVDAEEAHLFDYSLDTFN